MRPPIRATLLLVCLFTASAVLGQAGIIQFGQSFPLTNTRYGNVATSESVLVSNDAGTFLFWLGDEGVRVTKLGAPERQSGRLILESLRTVDVQGHVLDVVWTGTHFLVAASSYDGTKHVIAGRLLDANGDPVGERLTLVENGTAPALAASTSSILLVYASGRERTRLLTLTGTPAGPDLVLSDVTSASHDVASNGSGFAVVVSGLGRRETTLLNRDGVITAQTATNTNDTAIAIASDGSDYLLVTTSNNATHAHLLRANGAYERLTTLAGGGLARPAIAWNGDHYVVAYVATFPRELRVARVDREAQGVISEETRTLLVPSAPGVAVRAGRVHVAYGTNPVLISELPLASDPPDAATYAAFNQQLLAAVSSPDTTLVVWGEEGRLRAGVRYSDGRWREIVIEGVQGTHAVVETNGNGFLLLALSAEDATKSEAIRLDANGAPFAQRIAIPFRATDAVWTGTAYAIVGVTEDRLQAMFLESSGASPPIDVEILDEPIVAPIERAVIETDGEGFLVMWEEPRVTDILSPPVVSGWTIVATKLTDTLERVGPTNIDVDMFGQWPALAVRNGVYQMAWANGPKVYERSLHDDMLGPRTLVYSGVHDQTHVQIAVVGNLSYISWLDTFSAADTGAVHRVHTDFVSTRFRTAVPTTPLILGMPRGEIAYIGAAVLAGPPHYGSTRITMALGDVMTIPRTVQPPVAKARMQADRSVLIEWTAPQHAEGYRFEYRIGDGPWTEIERWFDPHERSTTFGPIPFGVTYTFRVRAWSSGGNGPYSNEVSPSPGRRRAVR